MLTIEDKRLWKERQGLFRQLLESGNGGVLGATVREQTTLLRRTHRRLQDSSGRNIRPALEKTLREFQASEGFLLVEREEWPDDD